jgi:hypothetical protein
VTFFAKVCFLEFFFEVLSQNFWISKEISKICDEVFIVKEVNKEALHNGLIDNNFLTENIHFISKIDYDFLKEVNQYDEKNVVLIENDLPNLYK